MITEAVAETVTSIQKYTNMSKAIRWQIPFVSIGGTHYRIDIYDEQDGSWSGAQTLIGGETPFETSEDDSDDYFEPIRPITGTIQICTRKPDGTLLNLKELLPANNLDKQVFVKNMDNLDVEFVGFLSCETYDQSYTTLPENISIPVIGMLETLKYVSLNSYWMGQDGVKTIGTFLDDIRTQLENDLGWQINTHFSDVCTDIMDKYVFIARYYKYETEESTGNVTYIHSAETLYNILEDICKFMGWCLRERNNTFYFVRIGNDETGITEINMSSLQWRGTDHKRTIMQGARQVSIESNLEEFKTSFEMPICPYVGLNNPVLYTGFGAYPLWYYEKCNQPQVGTFFSGDTTKCFLCRFYGVSDDGAQPWNVVYANIGFSNAIYLAGWNHEGADFTQIGRISSILDFSVISAKRLTREDIGHFVLKVTEERSRRLGIDGTIRIGIKYNNRYYNPTTGWDTFATAFNLSLSSGTGNLNIPIPRTYDVYTFITSPIEVILTNDFNIGGNSSIIISNISLSFEPPIVKGNSKGNKNRYIQNLSGARDNIKLDNNLASSFNNRNAYSHVYGSNLYEDGDTRVTYYEPIKTLTYRLLNGGRESRRPEVDMLNRMVEYYSKAMSRLELIVKHPTEAELPLLRFIGLNDGKKYLPLAEERDWQQETCTLTCFETPTETQESQS